MVVHNLKEGRNRKSNQAVVVVVVVVVAAMEILNVSCCLDDSSTTTPFGILKKYEIFRFFFPPASLAGGKSLRKSLIMFRPPSLCRGMSW